MISLRTIFIRLGWVCALTALTACSSLNPFGSDGPEPAKLTDFQVTTTLKINWQANIGGSDNYVFFPAQIGESVYAAAHDGSVARFENGKALWRSNVGSKLSAGVGTDGSVVAVVTVDGEVVALDAETGTPRWRTPLRIEVLAPPAVDATAVVLRASDNRVIALDAGQGQQRWVYQRSNPPLALYSAAGILLRDQVAVVGFPGGKIVAINVENGGALWELTVALPRGVTELERIADIAGTVVLGRSEVCAVAFQGRAGCFDLGNGSTIWNRDFSSSVGMNRDTRFVVITDEQSAVNALDAFTGDTVWKQEALSLRRVSRPLIVENHVAVGDFEGYVHLLNRETGDFVARTRLDSSAVVADPQPFGAGFLVQTRNGGIYALEAVN